MNNLPPAQQIQCSVAGGGVSPTGGMELEDGRDPVIGSFPCDVIEFIKGAKCVHPNVPHPDLSSNRHQCEPEEWFHRDRWMDALGHNTAPSHRPASAAAVG